MIKTAQYSSQLSALALQTQLYGGTGEHPSEFTHRQVSPETFLFS